MRSPFLHSLSVTPPSSLPGRCMKAPCFRPAFVALLVFFAVESLAAKEPPGRPDQNPPAAAPAVTPSIRIQWSPVAGSRGYGVQWERVDPAQPSRTAEPSPASESSPERKPATTSADAPSERTVQTTSVELRLSPGVYRIRVSALNRFGKAGGWSDWIDFRVEDTTVKQTLDLNRPKPVEPAPVVEKRPATSFSLRPWKAAVPGLLQIQSGHRYGWAYPVALAGIMGFGLQARLRGDRLADDPWNNPVYYTPFVLAAGATNGTNLGALLATRRSEQRQRYDALQRDQRLAGYSALLLLAIHGADLFRLDLGARSAVIVRDACLAIEVRF